MKHPVWARLFGSTLHERSRPELLAALPVFEGISKGQIRRIERLLHERNYEAAETVFNESEPGAGMYIIESGHIEITKRIEGSAPIVLAEFSDGDFFGELALVEEMPRTATAVATSPSTLLALPKPDLERLIERQPQLAVRIVHNLARLIARRLFKANENLERMNQDLDDGT